jgi:hypothetical protein
MSLIESHKDMVQYSSHTVNLQIEKWRRRQVYHNWDTPLPQEEGELRKYGNS